MFQVPDGGAFLAILLVSFVARFSALTQGFAVDDYVFLQLSGAWRDIWSVFEPSGRVGAAALLYVLSAIGGIQPRALAPAMIVAVAGFAYLSYLIARRWFRLRGRMALIVVGSLIAVYPYSAEVFSFRITALLYVVAFFLTVVALSLFSPARAGLIPSSLLYCLALSINQSVVSLSIAMLLALAAFAASLRISGRGGAIRREKFLFRRTAFGAATMVLGISLYAALLKVSSLAGAGDLGSRASFLPFSELPNRLGQIRDLAWGVFARPDAIIPLWPKILGGAVFFVALAFLSASLPPRRGAGTRVRHFVLVGIALVLLLLGIAGVNTLLREWWMVPRVLVQTVFVWIWPLVVLFTSKRNGMIRFATWTGCILAFSFVLSTGRILEDQKRLNSRDTQLGNRIVARLEACPTFAQMKRVVVVNFRGYLNDNISYVGDLNISVLSSWYAHASFLREVSGWNTLIYMGAEDRKKAADYCRAHAPWPSPESVTVTDDLGIVCLTR
jgi:hypothetical protein